MTGRDARDRDRTGPSRRRLWRYVLTAFSAVTAGFAAASLRGAEEFHVDPVAGLDSAERGTIERPWRTVHFALRRIDERESVAVHLRLRPALYRGGGRFDAHEEMFPWRIPESVRDFAVSPAPDVPGEVRIEVDDPGINAFDFRPRSSGPLSGLEPEPVRLRIEGLRFAGGYTALTAVGMEGRTFDVTVASSSFEGTSGAAVDLFAGPGSRLEARVTDSSFERCGAAVSIEGLDDSEISAQVSGNRFSGGPALGISGLLGGAVEVHAGSRTAVSGRFLRNIFRDTTSGLLFTAAQDALSFRALVANSLFFSACDAAGGSTPGCGMRQALYLSLWMHDGVDLRFVNNTVFGVDHQVIYRDNRQWLGSVPVPLEVVNNIFWGDGARPAGSFAGSGGLAPDGTVLAHNLVPESWMSDLAGPGGDGGNISADPRFEDPGAGSYRLLGDSPALDAGDAAATGDIGVADLDGRCRRTGPERDGPTAVDLGAYEAPGLCDPGLRLSFVRGDCFFDGSLDVGDAVTIFSYLFLGAQEPRCLDACDVNDDADVNVTDGVTALAYLFLGGEEPPAPFPVAGGDPTPDSHPDCLRE